MIIVYGKHEVFFLYNNELYRGDGKCIARGFLRIMAAMLIRGGVVAFEEIDREGNQKYFWCERKAKWSFA